MLLVLRFITRQSTRNKTVSIEETWSEREGKLEFEEVMFAQGTVSSPEGDHLEINALKKDAGRRQDLTTMAQRKVSQTAGQFERDMSRARERIVEQVSLRNRWSWSRMDGWVAVAYSGQFGRMLSGERRG